LVGTRGDGGGGGILPEGFELTQIFVDGSKEGDLREAFVGIAILLSIVAGIKANIANAFRQNCPHYYIDKISQLGTPSILHFK
jgi:hypothetical protein